MARVPLRRFVRAAAEPTSIAFATASSEAALPRAMENMEAFGVPRRIVAFVIPTGYSFNLDGSTLYLSLAAMFVAQAAGVQMSIGQQFLLETAVFFFGYFLAFAGPILAGSIADATGAITAAFWPSVAGAVLMAVMGLVVPRAMSRAPAPGPGPAATSAPGPK